MKIIQQTKTEKYEQYRITLKEHQALKEMSDNSNSKDYALLRDDNGVICLLTHSDNNKNAVKYKGIWCDTPSLLPLIREELNINKKDSCIVRVFCCNGNKINGYYEQETGSYITSAFNNENILNMSFNAYTVSFEDISA